MQETREIKFRFLAWEYPLGKEMATHCSILAWKIFTENEKFHGERSLVSYEHVHTNPAPRPPTHTLKVK